MKQELNQFLSYLEHERNAPLNTIISYKNDLSKLIDYLRERNIELKDVDHIAIRDFLLTQHKKKLKKITIYRKVSSIKSFFNFCKKKSWIRINPAKKIEFPKYEKPIPSFLTEKEVEMFLPLPLLTLRDYAIIELLYATGINVSELTAVNIDDISLKDKAILIRGWKKRYVFFGRKAERSLKYYLKSRSMLIEKGGEEKSLFLNYKGKRITPDSVGRIVERYWLLSGLAKKITPRSLRHSFASHMLGRGAKPYFVQELLGHKRLVSTEKYIRIDIRHLKAVHKKYHPRYFEQERSDIQPIEDVTNSYSFTNLIRY